VVEEKRRSGGKTCLGHNQRLKDVSGKKRTKTKGKRKSSPMGAEAILTDVAILFLAVTFWNYLQLENRLTPARRTWLSITGIFALVSILLQLFRR
jgi:hypothetical protein